MTRSVGSCSVSIPATVIGRQSAMQAAVRSENYHRHRSEAMKKSEQLPSRVPYPVLARASDEAGEDCKTPMTSTQDRLRPRASHALQGASSCRLARHASG
jgi:hypothetical protein